MSARSLLIVEDHTMISEYLASVTRAAGFEPVQAFTLAQARALLAARTFAAWVCDLHLPDGDGAALLSERSPDQARTPAVALTAGLDGDNRSRLIAAGFADALGKPCTPNELLETLARVLGNEGTPSPAHPPALDPADAPVLDDAAGLRVCGGDAQTLAAMRRLLATELPGVRERVAALAGSGDTVGLEGELHKLAAAAAWCGASQVAEACAALRRNLRELSETGAAQSELTAALDRLATALR